MDINKRSPALIWGIWLCGGIFYFYQFILRASPSVMATELMVSFGLTASSFGALAACYYYAYTFMQVPLGLLLDRFGPRLILRMTVIFCVCGTFLFALADTLWIAVIGRLMIGLGAAGAFLGTTRLVVGWFLPSQLAFVIGLTVSLGKLGGVSATIPLTFLVNYMNWRGALLIVGSIGICIAGLVWIFVDDHPSEKERFSNIQWTSDSEGPVQTLKSVVSRSVIWWVAIYGCLMYVPLSVFTDVWGVNFLMKAHSIDKVTASIMVSMLLAGTFVGAPLLAFISDRLGKRRLLMLLSALFSLIVNSILAFVSGLSVMNLGILLFLVGVGLTGQPLVFAVGSEIFPISRGGTVTGFLNSMIMLGGVILQPLVGLILDWTWDGLYENGIPDYSLSSYQMAISTIPISMMIACVASCLIPESGSFLKKKA